jgi:hypothetical protein
MEEDLLLRRFINSHAERLGCLEAIAAMTDLNAIRFCQQKEGYTPCFGRETPQYPNQDDTRLCTADCCWIYACNSYRISAIVPIEVFVENKDELNRLQKRLLDFDKTKKTSLTAGEVGVQIRSYQNISSVTRKMLIAAPKTVVGEATDDKLALKPHALVHSSFRGRSYGDWNIYHDLTVLFTSDLSGLKRWLFETQRFLESGNLAYSPLIQSLSYKKSYGKGSLMENQYAFDELPAPVDLKTFAAPHLGLPDGDIMLSNSEFAPILNIELPVLESIDFDTLFKLMADFPDELCAFRDFLHSSVEQMLNAATGSTDFAHNCRKIERDIREHLRKLESDYKKTRLKTAFSLTGCAVVSWMLALYCILRGKGDILTILGPGGMVFTLSAAYSEYLIQRLSLKNDPAYFLWLLGKTKN